MFQLPSCEIAKATSTASKSRTFITLKDIYLKFETTISFKFCDN